MTILCTHKRDWTPCCALSVQAPKCLLLCQTNPSLYTLHLILITLEAIIVFHLLHIKDTTDKMFISHTDIDECSPSNYIENKTCAYNAYCNNTVGDRNCTCYPGYDGNAYGRECTGNIL